ncbi:MAG: inorganic phosphate transporter [Acidobacteria bacterium]|nr:inorganic phosphate transporter [Acidobacteriota bacterium]
MRENALMTFWLVVAVLFLAYANGANDNFKGVATLFGSRTTSYRHALGWATAATLAGSCAAVFLSGRLIKAFSGDGLVPAALAGDPAFLVAVGLGGALTVLLAALTGWPISTTHALTGALAGAGLAGAGSIRVAALGATFFLPLALSPLIALALTSGLYPALRFLRLKLGVERQMCLCVNGELPQLLQVRADGSAVVRSSGIKLSIGQMQSCVEQYQGRFFGIDAQWVLDGLHFLSAGAVSFARGLNDTPKIVALLAGTSALQGSLPASLFAVGLAMAAGGLLNARRVAVTMSERITPMNHGQGFTANLVTAVLVTAASRWGLPVSTTHVSCGSLFGLGAATGQGRWGTIRAIFLSWIVTLPIAALSAAAVYSLL